MNDSSLGKTQKTLSESVGFTRGYAGADSALLRCHVRIRQPRLCKATTHWNAHDFLAQFGAVPTAGRVVRDGSLITAGGVTAGVDFGLTVVAELLGASEAQVIQLAFEYAPQPPFAAGTPELYEWLDGNEQTNPPQE